MNKFHCVNSLRARTLESQPSSLLTSSYQAQKRKEKTNPPRPNWRITCRRRFFLLFLSRSFDRPYFQPLSPLFLSSELFLLLPPERRLGKPTDWRGLIIPPLPTPFHLRRAACNRDIPDEERRPPSSPPLPPTVDAWRGNLVSLIIS